MSDEELVETSDVEDYVDVLESQEWRGISARMRDAYALLPARRVPGPQEPPLKRRKLDADDNLPFHHTMSSPFQDHSEPSSEADMHVGRHSPARRREHGIFEDVSLTPYASPSTGARSPRPPPPTSSPSPDEVVDKVNPHAPQRPGSSSVAYRASLSPTKRRRPQSSPERADSQFSIPTPPRSLESEPHAARADSPLVFPSSPAEDNSSRSSSPDPLALLPSPRHPSLVRRRVDAPSTPREEERSDSPPPAVTPPPSPPVVNELAPAPAEPPAPIVPAGKYSLRARKPQQLHVYKTDRRRYEHLLRHNPDAIVRDARRDRAIRDPDEEDDDFVADAESQMVSQTQEDSQGLAEDLDRSGSVHQPDLSHDADGSAAADAQDSDDSFATDEEIRDLREDIRKDEKARARQQRDEEKRKRRKKPRPFPLLEGQPRRSGKSVSRLVEDAASAVASSSRVTLDADAPAHSPSPERPFRRISRTRSLHPPAAHTLADDDWDMDPQVENHPPTPADPGFSLTAGSSAHESHSDGTPEPAGSEEEQHAQRKLPRRQAFALGHVMPKSMANKLLENAMLSSRAAQSAKSKSRHSDGVLAPGQSRTRTGALFTGEIKGDEESEEEVRSHADAQSWTHDIEIASVDDRSDDEDSRVLVFSNKRSLPRHRPRQDAGVADGRNDDVVTDDETLVHTDSSVDEDEVEGWMNRTSTWVSRSAPRARAEAPPRPPRLKEGDLFDRMLTRAPATEASRRRRNGHGARSSARRRATTSSRAPRPTGGSVKSGHLRPPRVADHPSNSGSHHREPASAKRQSSSAAKVHVVTQGAKRYGAGHQQMLPFAPRFVETPANAQPFDNRNAAEGSGVAHFVHHVGEVQGHEKNTTERKKKRKHRPVGSTYTFDSGGNTITSDRARLVATVIVEDEAFVRAVSEFPERRAVPPPVPRRPALDVRIGVPTGAAMRQGTLHQFAMPKPVSRRAQPSSAPWTGRDITNEYALGELPELPELPDLPHPSSHRQGVRRFFVADCEVLPLRRGLRFSGKTYVGKYHLIELLSIWNVTVSTDSSASTTADTVVNEAPADEAPFTRIKTCLDSLPLALEDYIRSGSSSTDDHAHAAREKMRATCRSLTDTLPRLGSEQASQVCRAAKSVLDRLADSLDARFPDGAELSLDDASLSVAWFLAELALRIEANPCGHEWDHGIATTLLGRIVQWLFGHGIHRALRAVEAVPTTGQEIDNVLLDERAAELWVCLLHVASKRKVPPKLSTWFANLLGDLIKADQPATSAPEACDRHSKEIFSLCALTHFSQGGMVTSSPSVVIPGAWDLVLTIFAPIKFKAGDAEGDLDHPSIVLTARDAYLRVIISRCHVFCDRWSWKLDNPMPVINKLYDIFRSRRFANLRQDMHKPDLARFLQHEDEEGEMKPREDDTAFEILLKILLRAGRDLCPSPSSPPAPPTGKFKQLLSMMVPTGVQQLEVGPFAQISSKELSVAYNRLSAVAVAIIMDPYPANVQSRIETAQKLVQFKDAPWQLRQACIRIMLSIALALGRRHKQSVVPALEWAEKMADTLLDEFQDCVDPKLAPALRTSRSAVEFNLKLLLRALNVIFRKVYLAGSNNNSYPETKFLTGPWIKRLITSDLLLKASSEIGVEVRTLVQDFLQARTQALPAPAVPVEESQESQEGYATEALDEDILAQLAQYDDLSTFQMVSQKDDEVVEVLAKVITYALYTFLSRQPALGEDFENHLDDLYAWVDCWAGCATIVIDKKRHDWAYYMHLGRMSWDRHGDTMFRRRVGLRFMFHSLRLAPQSYETCARAVGPAQGHDAQHLDFLKRLMDALATSRIDFEHEYFSRLLLCDRFRHPLFDGLREELPGWDSEKGLTKEQFAAYRLSIINRLAANLAAHIRQQGVPEPVIASHLQEELVLFETLLFAVRDAADLIAAHDDESVAYADFASQLRQILERHGLTDHPRLRTSLNVAFPPNAS